MEDRDELLAIRSQDQRRSTHATAHCACRRQKGLAVQSVPPRIREVLCDVSAGLSNDLKVSDHSILATRAPAELGIAQAGCIVFDPIDGSENVIQKVVQLK